MFTLVEVTAANVIVIGTVVGLSVLVAIWLRPPGPIPPLVETWPGPFGPWLNLWLSVTLLFALLGTVVRLIKLALQPPSRRSR